MRRFRVYGELVALLCAEDRDAQALSLEAFWNGLARAFEFKFFRGYPIKAFESGDHALAFEHVCRAHTLVRPAEGGAALMMGAAAGRTVAALQSKTRTLDAELARRQAAERAPRARDEALGDFVASAVASLHRVAADGPISGVVCSRTPPPEPVRTGSGGLPRRVGPDPRKRRADALLGGRHPAIARHLVPLHAAAGRALEGDRQRHHRAPPGWQLAHPLQTGGCAPHADGDGQSGGALSHRAGPASGRPLEAAHDIAPWLDYFWGVLLRAYKEFEQRVGTIERGRGVKGDRVRAEVLKRTLPFSISEIEAACPGVSRDMVRLVLRAMKAEGLIAPTGKGRGARWVSLRPQTLQ